MPATFPLWLAPVQAVVADDHGCRGRSLRRKGCCQGAARLPACASRRIFRNEKINYKVREHSLQKVPVIAVVGGREAEERTLALRRLGSNGQQIIALDEAATLLSQEGLAPDLKA